MKIFSSFCLILSLLQTYNLSKILSKKENHNPNPISWPIKSHRSVFNKSVPLLNKNDVEYLVSIKIGTNAQEYQLMIDTSSSDIWVPYYVCQGCNQIKKYHCGISRTCYIDKTNRVGVKYIDGKAEGFIAYDQFRIEPGIFIPQQSFTVLDRVAGEIANVEGVLGLSLSGFTMNHNPSFLENLYDMGIIKKLMYSLYLASEKNEKGNKNSRLVLGDIDPSFIKEGNDIHWINMTSDMKTPIPYKSIKIGDLLIKRNRKHAQINSGHSCFTIPVSDITQIRDILERLYNIRCYFYKEDHAPDFSMMNCLLTNNSKEFPPITININEGSFPLEAKDYIYECKLLANKTVQCFTKLEMSVHFKHIVLGLAFHNSYYIIHNLKDKQYGIAPSIANNKFDVYNIRGKQVGTAINCQEVFDLFSGELVKPIKLISNEKKEIKVEEKLNYEAVPMVIYITVISLIMIIIIGLLIFLFNFLSAKKVDC